MSTKYKIGVFGSAINESAEAIEKVKQLGCLLGQRECVVITGACSGMPYIAAEMAMQHGAEVWGYSPAKTFKEQVQFEPNDNHDIYEKLFYVRDTFEFKDNRLVSIKFRNVLSTAACDAGIIVSGRWGTLNEFTNLFDMGKVIGVLTGTGGIADELPALTKSVKKASKSAVFFDSDPNALIENILNTLGK